MMRTALGIYVHLPFCESKCDYCHFASGVYPRTMVAPYLKALKEEIRNLRTIANTMDIDYECVSLSSVDTIYLGGGTPSFIDGNHIVEIIKTLRQVFDFASAVEITLEVNPGSVDPEKISYYQEAGVNRISVGMQTFQDQILKGIGRSHSVQDAVTTFKLFRKMGMKNISFDVIAGLPGQTEKNWRENLRMIESLSPEHISLYMLEIHENTRFGKIYGKHESGESEQHEKRLHPDLPDEDLVGQFYFEAVDRFESHGYCQYEISNFAKPGYQSRHNLKYWTDQPFIGFGCGAYSYLDGKRWGNERGVGRYMELLQHQYHAIDFRSELTPRQREEEAIFLGLRLTQGIHLSQFQTKFGFDLRERFKDQINYLEEGELIEFTPDRLRLTAKGWMLSNEVFLQFLQ